MRWFDLRLLGAFALVASSCSDDGVPADAGATDSAASGSASASAGESDSAGETSAVTTASGSDTADTTATTDPTGTDTDGTSGPGGSSGGVGSTGGEGSTGGSTTGGTSEPECMVDEDCVLVDDCCSCTSIAAGEEPPACEVEECAQSTCASVGLDMPPVQCNLGTCEVEPVECNPLAVECDSLPPDCPDGQSPRVVDGCWGACIPVEYCDVVPGCESCSEDEACVESVTQIGNSLTCVPIPPACEGVPSCDCMGEACEDPFDACSDAIEPKSGSELSCSCLAC